MSTTRLARGAAAPAVVCCLALVGLGVAAPASASQPRDRIVRFDAGPYATPLSALGGLTLAQYLAAHQAGDRRLR